MEDWIKCQISLNIVNNGISTTTFLHTCTHIESKLVDLYIY